MKYKGFLFLLSVIYSIHCFQYVYAAAPAQTIQKDKASASSAPQTMQITNQKAGADKKATAITSDGELVMDYAKNVATFNNNVIVKNEDGTMRCDKLTVVFSTESGTIDRMVAQDHVEIVLPSETVQGKKAKSERRSTSDQAVYYANEKKIILTGSPSIKQEGNTYAADTITIYPAEDRVIFEPSARLIIYSADEKQLL